MLPRMGRILQTDPRMPYPTQRWGCNFRSLLGIVETLEEMTFSAEEILWAWIEAQWRKLDNVQGMLKDGTVQVPQVILDLGFEILEVPKTAYDIGSRGPLGESFWGWVRDKRIDATILKGRTLLGNWHFREGDPQGVEIWNPDPEVELEKEVAVIYYQVQEKG